MDSSSQKARKLGGPTSLFQRILLQTQKQQVSKLAINESVPEVLSSVSNTTSQMDKIDKPNDEGFGFDYANKVIGLLLSSKGTVREKVHALKELRNYSSNDAVTLEKVISKDVISYGEKLLISYCDRSYVTEEYKLLLPLLSLFNAYTNMVETKVYEALMVKQSDFMYQLMRSCVMCVDTMLSKSEELIKLAKKKKLAGHVRKLAEEDSLVKLARLLGILPSTSSNEVDVPEALELIESYQVTLFDTTSGSTDKNINEHILNMENPSLVDSSSELCDTQDSDIVSRSANEQEWNWSDTVVASVLPFGQFLAYTKGDWSHWLQVINGELSEYLRILKSENCENDGNLQFTNGSIVGFWSNDVKFKWKPLMMMQCFRGIVLGKAVSGMEGRTEMCWAIWAVDVGTLVFGDKFWPLDHNFSSIPPLVCICSLYMGEGDGRGESQFLLVALKLLSKLLATNPTASRHMVAFGSRKSDYACDVFSEDGKTCDGGVFLMLISYTHIEIRIEFLKLMMLLARSSSEIIRYLLECRFYLAVCNRLEICVYFCHLLPPDSTQWSEVRLLVMLLSTMSEGIEVNLAELPGWDRVEKVLLMLTEIENHTYLRYMAAKCLAGLENHKTRAPSAYKGVKHGPTGGGRSSQCHEVNQVSGVSGNHNKDSEMLRRSNQRRFPACSSREINPAVCSAMDSEAPEPLLSVMDVGDDSSSDDEVSDLPPVDAVADMARQMDRYTKGYRVTISNDMTHELSEEKNANQISENNLAQNICAFLNNGVGGSVYFGINSKGIIEGLKMTRIQRDSFRKGVDRMMTRSIYPEVRPVCYDVIYVPVYGPGEVVKGLASHLIWVVEVHVKALPHVIYAVSSNRRCYVRQGPNSVESMSICLRQEAAEQNQKEILEAIEEAKAKIPANREKLMTFVQSYLEQSKNIA
ncbi:uncharacterized protein LOC124164869 isoform X1 [Ischnura elegans]|uniref:uncharacterized protein LOC124164869 isoform X1 n=1 Tax=Ischnura elegans TaxID=197161 RepID=UPI001ED874BF|nr:uncharacterized protein LOC124164869 isoform X1 [Ischnura elegans]XP_046398042.1 uncharacterized protein LOC124164869 isoform X1 [Ischnura elegans]